jgi:hypothetical protein
MQYCKINNCRFSYSHVSKGHKCGKCNNYGHGLTECNNDFAKQNLNKYFLDVIPSNYECTRPKCLYKKLHTTDGHFCELCNAKHSSYNCLLNHDFITRKELELNSISQSKIKCPKCRTYNEINESNYTSDEQSLECIVCTDKNKKMLFLPQCKHICVCIDCSHLMRENIDNVQGLSPMNTYDEINSVAQKKFAKIPDKIYTTIYIGMGCNYLIRRDDIGHLSELWYYHSDDGYDQNRIDEMNKFIEGYKLIN